MDPRLARRFEVAISAGAASIAALAGLVLIGWVFDIAALKSLRPGLAAMSVPTALSFILCSLSLYALAGKTRPSWRIALMRGPAAIVLALSVYALASHTSGFPSPGADGYVFGPRLGQVALATGCEFFLLAAALLAESWHAGRLRTSLAVLGLAVAAAALFGYAYGAKTLYQFEPFSGMAFSTAFGFTVLFSCALVARPQEDRLAHFIAGGRGMVAAVALAGLVVSLAVFSVARRADEARVLTSLQLRVEWRVQDMENKIQLASGSVEALALFIATQKTVDPAAFDLYSQLMQQPGDGLDALIWAPLVKGPERADFVAAARKHGDADFDIRERAPDGKLAPAPPRFEYLPVSIEQPFAGRKSVPGVDLYSEPSRRAAIWAARDKGRAVAVVQVSILNAADKSPGYLVFAPVYKGGVVPETVEGRRVDFRGVVGGRYAMERMLDRAVLNTPPFIANVDIFVDTVDPAPPPLHVARYDLAAGKFLVAPPDSADPSDNGAEFTRSFSVLGRRWTLDFHFPPLIVSESRSDGPWALFGFSLLLTALLTAYFHREQERRLGVERQFAAIVANSDDAIIGKDLNGIVRSWNSGAEAMFGWRAEEIVGKPIATLFPPDRLGEEDHFLARLRAGERIDHYETVRRRKNGEDIEVSVTISPIRAPNGEIIGASKIARDIGQRKRAEEHLRASETRLRAIVDSSVDGLITIDQRGTVTSFSKPAEHIFGYGADEVTGRNVKMLMPEPYHGEHDGYLAVYAATGIGKIIGIGREVQGRHKDGSIFPMDLAVAEIPNERGIREFVGSVRDITERKLAIDHLRLSEERFRSIFGAVSEGIFIIDLETGTFIDVNDPGSAMFGYAPGELIGKDIEYLSSGEPPYTKQGAAISLSKAAASGRPDRFDWHCKAKDGRLFWAEISHRFVSINNRNVILGVLRDITERLAVEAQLHQSQKMEAIGNLTGGMAHDFNNLLGIVIGNLDLLAPRLKDDKDSRDLLQDSLEASLRGAELTRRLLAFARRQPLQPERIDVNILVENMTKLLARTLGEAIEISLAPAPGLWPVIADPAQLNAALTNLATNARDAMPRGGKLIIATANRHLDVDYAAQHPEVKPGDYALIEVSDTGTGIAPDAINRIFEPFFTTKEPGKGTGLGLSMVFGFMKQSGGHINVYSERGKGTTFRLYLPRDTNGDAAKAATKVLTAPAHAGESVLAVEDNERLRRVVVRQLNELGYRVFEAADAAGALAILERESIDLLFTDVVMPGGVDGFELARRAGALRPKLRVLLTSGFPEARLNGEAGHAENIRLLNKPYPKEELAAALRAVLDS